MSWHSMNQINHNLLHWFPILEELAIEIFSPIPILDTTHHSMWLLSWQPLSWNLPVRHITAGSSTEWSTEMALLHEACPELVRAPSTRIAAYPRRPFPAQRFGVSPRCTFLPLRITVTLRGLWEKWKKEKMSSLISIIKYPIAVVASLAIPQ